MTGQVDHRGPMTTPNQQDARRRIQELLDVRAALAPDCDDPKVLSELTSIEGQLVAARRELTPTITSMPSRRPA